MTTGAILLYTALAEGGIVAAYFLSRLIKKLRQKSPEELAKEAQERAERQRVAEERARQDRERARQEEERFEREAARIREVEAGAERKRQAQRDIKVAVIKRKGGLLVDLLEKLGNVPDHFLQIMYLSAMQSEIAFDLETERALRPVVYPTSHMDFVQVTDASQLVDVLPSQMIYDDYLFYQMFANATLLRTQFYELIAKGKRLYILFDISPSMWDMERGGRMTLPNGEDGSRDQFARGILASLLIEAVNGDAEYVLRFFDDNPREIISAKDSTEAASLLERIVTKSERGSGTKIGIAVKTAVDDIRSRQEDEAKMNHILLITDGEDNGGLTKEYLAENLGEDVKLSAIVIGAEWKDDNALAPYVIAKY